MNEIKKKILNNIITPDKITVKPIDAINKEYNILYNELYSALLKHINRRLKGEWETNERIISSCKFYFWRRYFSKKAYRNFSHNNICKDIIKDLRKSGKWKYCYINRCSFPKFYFYKEKPSLFLRIYREFRYIIF